MSMIMPDGFKKFWNDPKSKGAFVSVISPMHPRDCKNCGGIGTIILFVATGGPFINVPSGVAHWHNDRWWSGKNYEEGCPVCKGTGINPGYVEQPPKQRELVLTDFTV